MNLSSMTGFSRSSDHLSLKDGEVDWVWELKSVNGKSLDLKYRLPSTLESLALQLKNIAMQYLTRGNISVSLDIKNSSRRQQIKINEDLLNELAEQAGKLFERYGEQMQKPSCSELLNIRGVVEIEEKNLDESDCRLLEENLVKSFAEACHLLNVDRRGEGAKIKVVLHNILDRIEDVVMQIEKIAEEHPKKIKSRLEEQIRQWLEPGVEISEDRLAQELVFYITRADIQEEIDRLKTHIKTARHLLEAEDVAGRRLDFLCQELNREANTTCSKSCDSGLTNLGMELKALIEQFREQVQNIE